MRLVINDTVIHDEPAAAVTIAADDKLRFEWQPVSGFVGIGREGIGQETAGFGGTLAPDIRQTTVQILDPVTEELVAESDPILQPTRVYTYTAAQNQADHGGVYATDMLIRIVQYDQQGRVAVIDEVETT